jgi:hypothetical protein
MKRTAIIIGWLLVIAGGIAVSAGVIHSFWVLWSIGPMGLFNYLPVILVFSGMFAAAIGLTLISWTKSMNKASK